METPTAKSEVSRKLLHLAIGSGCATLIYLTGSQGGLLLASLLASGILLGFMEKKQPLPLITLLLNTMERPRDRLTLPGKGFLLMLAASSTLSWLFSPRIAAAAILILAIGDSIGHLSGSALRRLWAVQHQKLWAGTAIGIACATSFAAILVPWAHALTASVVALVLENQLMNSGTVLFDDNILVPISAGMVLFLLQYIPL